MTSDPFQLKIALDNDDAVAVDYIYEFNNTKWGKFGVYDAIKKLTNFGDSLSSEPPKH